MAVTSRTVRVEQQGKRRQLPLAGELKVQVQRLSQSSGSMLWIVLAALLLALLLGSIGGWMRTKLDDLRYGRPRMDTIAGVVGHEQTPGQVTQFVAMNLNRQVVIIEFPGSDPAQARTIIGPYLFGQGEDLRPVTLDLRDVNSDGRPDLLATIKSEVLVYINEQSGFRLMTPDEQQRLLEQSQ